MKDRTLDSVGTSTDEVYWLPCNLHSISTTRRQLIKHYVNSCYTDPTGKQGQVKQHQ
jgi:hypothetical protein